MGKFPPNHYQQDIIDWVINGEGNDLVNALAGTGKTSTLELVASTYTGKMLFLAFNNHIAAELNEKPDLQHYLKKKDEGGAATLKVMTVNSLGNMAMQEAIRNRTDLSYRKDGYLKPNKLLSILGRIIRVYCDTKKEKVTDDMVWAMQRDLKIACDKARSKYVKDDEDSIQRVIDEDGLCQFNMPNDGIENEIMFPILPWAKIGEEALETSMAMYEDRGEYDFVEQLYIPVVKNLPFPSWLAWYSSFIGVDECIPYDYYVMTNKGKIRLDALHKRIKNGENILAKSFNERTQQFEFKPIVNTINKGKKQVYKIKTEGLKVIEATDNHPILTQRGWVKVSDLRVGKDIILSDNPQNQKTKFMLNPDQYQIALASSIGDGHLQKMSDYNTFRIKFTHQKKQEDYLNFKKEMFSCCKPYFGTSGYTKRKDILNISTKTFIMIDDPKQSLKQMNEKAFAIWYMDDGSITSDGKLCNTKIFCNNLTEEQCKDCQYALETYGIKTIRVVVRNKYQELHFDTKNAERFLKLIAPYMHPDCFYKNPFSTGEYQWDYSGYKEFGGDYIKSISISRTCEVYDIEVKDNHNFLVSKNHSNKNGSNIIVHNCQDLSKLQLRVIKKLINMQLPKKFGVKKPTRFLFVGDSKQAIYSFAGADCHSIENIRRQFSPQELPLNICYRCAKKVIKLAQQDVPAIESAPNAIEGEVHVIKNEDIAQLIQPRRYGNCKKE